MAYNEQTLPANLKSGINPYITDLNAKFTDDLYTTKERKFYGLARTDISGVPRYNDSGTYIDVLFNDKYDLSLFYIESGDREMKPYSFESKIDLIVTAKMTSFTGIEEEDIIEEVYQILKLTSFEPTALARDVNALTGFDYNDKIKETMHPYFVFRFKCKLIGQLKQ